MKNLFKAVVLCLCLALTVSFVYARGGRGGAGGRGGRCSGFGNGLGYGNASGATIKPNYVDKNSDGICDNSGTAIRQRYRNTKQQQYRKTNPIEKGSLTQTNKGE
ncbi:MAG TPA: hypothetical protein DD405_07420 [Desulfobacteraceae bacterium]|nr:hypothetical protein [Desulfobacteraceae bacterium]